MRGSGANCDRISQRTQRASQNAYLAELYRRSLAAFAIAAKVPAFSLESVKLRLSPFYAAFRVVPPSENSLPAEGFLFAIAAFMSLSCADSTK